MPARAGKLDPELVALREGAGPMLLLKGMAALLPVAILSLLFFVEASC